MRGVCTQHNVTHEPAVCHLHIQYYRARCQDCGQVSLHNSRFRVQIKYFDAIRRALALGGCDETSQGVNKMFWNWRASGLVTYDLEFTITTDNSSSSDAANPHIPSQHPLTAAIIPSQQQAEAQELAISWRYGDCSHPI